MRVQTDDGVALNAEFSVEAEGPHLNLVLESAGGKTASGRPRNEGYVPALRVLLERLRSHRAVLLAALVASSRLATLPESERTLLDEPVDLVDVTDIERLRLDITALRQSRFVRSKPACEGFYPEDETLGGVRCAVTNSP